MSLHNISMTLMNPAYAVGFLVITAVIAAIAGRLIPFYREELRVEDVTRLTPLDGLRGILCFAVLCHHAVSTQVYLRTGEWVPPVSFVYRMMGEDAVKFFFAVTAFLFWSRALKSGGRIPTWTFLRGRWYRIAPLYIFSAIFAIAAAAPHIPWHSLGTYKDIFRLFALMVVRPWDTIGGFTIGSVDAFVTWTLQYEWAFYIALPALALVAREDGGWRIFLVLLAANLLGIQGAPVSFAIGILAAQIYRREEFRPFLQGRLCAVIVILAAIALPLAAHHIGKQPVNVLLLAIAFVPIACGNSLFGLLNFSGLRLMGVISYSVYLLHGIALYLSRPLLMKLGGSPVHEAVTFWMWTMGIGLAVLIGSMLTYRFVEHPFIQKEKRLRAARPAVLTIPANAEAVNPAASGAADDTAAIVRGVDNAASDRPEPPEPVVSGTTAA